MQSFDLHNLLSYHHVYVEFFLRQTYSILGPQHLILRLQRLILRLQRLILIHEDLDQ